MESIYMSKRKPERIKKLRKFVDEQFKEFAPSRIKRTTKSLEKRGRKLHMQVQARAPRGKATLKHILTKNVLPRTGKAVRSTIREAVNPDEKR